MPIEDIIGLILCSVCLISLLVLLFYTCIKYCDCDKKLRESQIKLNKIKYEYYKWLLDDTNYNGALEEEHEEF